MPNSKVHLPNQILDASEYAKKCIADGLVTGAMICDQTLGEMLNQNDGTYLMIQRYIGENEIIQNMQRSSELFGCVSVDTHRIHGIVANRLNKGINRYQWNHENANELKEKYGYNFLYEAPEEMPLSINGIDISAVQKLPCGEKYRLEISESIICVFSADEEKSIEALFTTWQGTDLENNRKFDPWDYPVHIITGDLSKLSSDLGVLVNATVECDVNGKHFFAIHPSRVHFHQDSGLASNCRTGPSQSFVIINEVFYKYMGGK